MIMAEEVSPSFLHLVIHSFKKSFIYSRIQHSFKKHSLNAEISTKKNTKFLSQNSQSQAGSEVGDQQELDNYDNIQ